MSLVIAASDGDLDCVIAAVGGGEDIDGHHIVHMGIQPCMKLVGKDMLIS